MTDKQPEAYWLIAPNGQYYKNPKHPMNTQQPEAQRLADDLEILEDTIGDGICKEAAAELRRLYALNQEMLEALKEIEWSNNERWRTDRARAAIAKAQEQA